MLALISLQSSADVIMQWKTPNLRENGTALPLEKLGGYVIKYRKTTDPATVPDTVIVIPDNKAAEYPIIGVTSDNYKFTIAAYDSDGLHSDYVTVSLLVIAKPTAPAAVKVANKTLNVVAACIAAAPNCRVAVVGEWK